MPKFYVWCGDIRFVAEADNNIEACVKAVHHNEDKMNSDIRIASDFIANEQGFESMYKNIGETYPTEEILKRAGYEIE